LNLPPRRKVKLAVAIPASLTVDIPHLRDKTLKVGFIGRAFAIFRVDEIVIYMDRKETKVRREANFIISILKYMDTPQYLRRRLFKIKPELKFVGVLPPLRTPHHPLRNKIEQIEIGEFREGIVVSTTKEGSLIDIGVEKPLLLPERKLKVGSRITVKVKCLKPKALLELVDKNEVPWYWGYKVKFTSNFKNLSGDFDLIIATSKYGVQISEVLEDIKRKWVKSRNVLIVFGSPEEGLYDIALRHGIELDNWADFVVNTIPCQGTETVRTEEAIYATLSIVNLFIRD